MDWDDLRVFLAVARAESLSGAGRVLKIDPATVGRRVARLEDAMGARLFVKGPQGYALSDEGARLLAHAEESGAKTVGGVEMFVRQAAAQFEAWTHHRAPTDTMRQVIERRLSVR